MVAKRVIQRSLVLVALTVIATFDLAAWGQANVPPVINLQDRIDLQGRTKQLLDDLGSDSFTKRRLAFRELRVLGKISLPSIVEASRSSIRQVAQDAELLKQLIEYDLKFHDAKLSEKLTEESGDIGEQTLLELARRGHWDAVYSLISASENLQRKMRISSPLYEELLELAMEQGEIDAAWRCIKLIASADSVAWLSRKTGMDASDVIEQSPANVKSRLIYLIGDMAKALELAVSDQQRIGLLMRSWQWDAMLEERNLNWLLPKPDDAACKSAKAVLLEFAGRWDESQALWAEVLKLSDEESERDTSEERAGEGTAAKSSETRQVLALMKEYDGRETANRDEQNLLLLSLLSSGRIEPVIDYYKTLDPNAAFSFLSTSNQYEACLEIVGLKTDLSNLDEWIATSCEDIGKALEEDTTDSLSMIGDVASLLVSIGYKDEAKKIVNALIDLTQQHPDYAHTIWDSAILSWHMRDQWTSLMLDEILPEHPQLPKAFRSKIYDEIYPDLSGMAWTARNCMIRCLSQVPNSDVDPEECLKRFYRADRKFLDAISEDFTETILRELYDEIQADLNSEQPLGNELSSVAIQKLGYLAELLGCNDIAFEFYLAEPIVYSRLGVTDIPWLDAARLMEEQGHIESAQQIIAGLRKQGISDASVTIAEYKNLIMASQFSLANRVYSMLWLRGAPTIGQVDEDFSQQSKYFQLHEEPVWAEEFSEAAWTLTNPLDIKSTVYAWDYAATLTENKKFALAADVQRTSLIECFKLGSQQLERYIRPGYLSYIKMQVEKERFNRALACIEQSKFDEADRHLQVCFQIDPAGIETIIQSFPKLVAAGREDIARKYLLLHADAMTKHVERWPKDATALNNLAWLYSQCDFQLQKALELSERAVALVPESPVYLDTLAEIHYRMGNTAKAYDLSVECVRIDPRDNRYQANVKRMTSPYEAAR